MCAHTLKKLGMLLIIKLTYVCAFYCFLPWDHRKNRSQRLEMRKKRKKKKALFITKKKQVRNTKSVSVFGGLLLRERQEGKKRLWYRKSI